MRPRLIRFSPAASHAFRTAERPIPRCRFLRYADDMKMPVCTPAQPRPACASCCDCDPALRLPVGLLPSPGQPGVSACLCCGSIVSDLSPRETLTPETRAWLDRWPRLLATPAGDFACLPSSLRCENPAALASLRTSAWNAQRHLPRGRRLRRAGWPKTPPPDSLPSSLSHYRLLWEAAGFTPATDLDTLLYWANPAHTLESPLALDALLQRRDLRLLLPGLTHSPVLHRRTVLCALAQEDASLVSLLRPHVQSWLQRHERAPDSPQKRALSPEADACRASLRAWLLTRASARNTPAAEVRPRSAHEAPLFADA